MRLIVLDNGGGWVKASLIYCGTSLEGLPEGPSDQSTTGGDTCGDKWGSRSVPTCVEPNCLAEWRKKADVFEVGSERIKKMMNSYTVHRPVQAGVLLELNFERVVWSYVFHSLLGQSWDPSTFHTLDMTGYNLLLTETLGLPPVQYHALQKLIFESFNFDAAFITLSSSLVNSLWLSHSQYQGQGQGQSPSLLPVPTAVTVDVGYSGVIAVPYFEDTPIHIASRRSNVGGHVLDKALLRLIALRNPDLRLEGAALWVENLRRQIIRFSPTREDFLARVTEAAKAVRTRRELAQAKQDSERTQEKLRKLRQSGLLLEIPIPSIGGRKPFVPPSAAPKAAEATLGAADESATPVFLLGPEAWQLGEALFHPGEILGPELATLATSTTSAGAEGASGGGADRRRVSAPTEKEAEEGRQEYLHRAVQDWTHVASLSNVSSSFGSSFGSSGASLGEGERSVKLIDRSKGVAEVIVDAILSAPPIIQSALAENILVYGGLADTEGFLPRLQVELCTRLPSAWRVQIRLATSLCHRTAQVTQSKKEGLHSFDVVHAAAVKWARENFEHHRITKQAFLESIKPRKKNRPDIP